MTRVLVGPATVQASGAAVIDSGPASAALAGIDDEIALLGERAVGVATLWRSVFESATVDEAFGPMLLICPSWWPPQRVELIANAAPAAVVMRRAQLLARCAARRPVVVVEIAPHMVVVSRIPPAASDDDDIRPAIAHSRDDTPPDSVAAATARSVASVREAGAAVVVDSPHGVGGASTLAAMIADRIRALGCAAVAVVDDGRLLRTAAAMALSGDPPSPAFAAAEDRPSVHRRAVVATTAATVVIAAVVATAVVAHRGEDPSAEPMPMTVLVEGRMAVRVPAQWTAQRITGGPGSARLQIGSPTDAHAAVHVTQSPIPSGETLERTAETLRRAIDEQPPGLFVDFNPAERLGPRTAVTYREIRSGHDIRWAVLLAEPIRISIGCQSAPGREDAVRYPCEQAVASAHAVR